MRAIAVVYKQYKNFMLKINLIKVVTQIKINTSIKRLESMHTYKTESATRAFFFYKIVREQTESFWRQHNIRFYDVNFLRGGLKLVGRINFNFKFFITFTLVFLYINLSLYMKQICKKNSNICSFVNIWYEYLKHQNKIVKYKM